MNTKRITVVLVDDDALVRRVIASSLERFPDIEVVGTASDSRAARDMISDVQPDVMVLDLSMPGVDGLSFLKIVMKHRPLPVIVMSSFTEKNADRITQAFNAGAVDVVNKSEITGALLAQKILAAVSATAEPTPTKPSITQRPQRAIEPAAHDENRRFSARDIILLGASTGGTEALKVVLTSLPRDLPGICIVQHIPPRFSASFANRMNELCAMDVREAEHGDVVRPGLALVAPGGFHMVLKWTGGHYIVELNQEPKVHHQRPAVDILFQSAVRAGAGTHAIAAVLTGMGGDGAAGLLELREAGAKTIAQDEATSIVFGMPCQAIRLGAAQDVLPLRSIGPRLEQLALVNSDKS